MKVPRIVIVGAGPGGLCAAAVLRRHDIDAVVCERDASPSARPQGGSLDLDVEGGQWALERAGLTAPFRRLARHAGQDQVLVDPTGHEWVRQVTAPDAAWGRPEIDRADLRSLLLGALPADAVRWGHAGREIRPDGDGWLVATDEGELPADLVIGADGAWSRMRSMLTDAVPAPVGTVAIELGIADADSRRPELAAMVGRGNYWAVGEGLSLSAQRTGSGRIRVYLSVPGGPEWPAVSGVPWDDPAAARAALAGLLDGWAPPLVELVLSCDDTIVVRVIHALPVGLRWDPVPGVTLVGDAAHLMPPVGNGANTAMRDGAELALAIVEHGADVAGAVAAYEPAMFTRSAAAAQQSEAVQRIVLSGAQALARVIS